MAGDTKIIKIYENVDPFRRDWLAGDCLVGDFSGLMMGGSVQRKHTEKDQGKEEADEHREEKARKEDEQKALMSKLF